MERVTVALYLLEWTYPRLETGAKLCLTAMGFRQFMRMDISCRTGILAHVLEAFSIDLVR